MSNLTHGYGSYISEYHNDVLKDLKILWKLIKVLQSMSM
jgi:hypothetical protein